MSKTKCHYCKATVSPEARKRVITRVSDSFSVKTFCDHKCADEYFFMIGLQTTVIIILIIGLGLAWLLK
jgi:hypothetical protein